jgi:hypothetical protein
VSDSDKKSWTAPEIRHFDDPDELWEAYKLKGTPEQRAKLKAMLDVGPRRQAPPKLRRAS